MNFIIMHKSDILLRWSDEYIYHGSPPSETSESMKVPDSFGILNSKSYNLPEIKKSGYHTKSYRYSKGSKICSID